MVWIKNNWIICVLLLIGAGFVFIQWIHPAQEQKQQGFTIEDAEKQEEQLKEAKESGIKSPVALVDVKGEVNKPGVYEVTTEVRVGEVIEQAGGFTENANQLAVNLAQRIQDEMVILVPKKGEESPTGGSISVQSNKISINSANQSELEELNGIGEKKALAIIEYREEHGNFQSKEDILQVPGIGEKTLANFENQLRVP
ncbi:helix-hairpin-helix domain-containing protein [Radiobacillus kanasensis]|uniref:helix-hairpin-helix domain-containing protein n=1 Tax=Radiobacillus kanasensis TaxID=2844358 RepID=UPI001E507845|nr:helix-hairpin-helix domain-containing protein [Radiobacillus kanasensis]UFT97838.1 helix-hairpin-helix domain-containing protein [Radiobacillus kanasensis]